MVFLCVGCLFVRLFIYLFLAYISLSFGCLFGFFRYLPLQHPPPPPPHPSFYSFITSKFVCLFYDLFCEINIHGSMFNGFVCLFCFVVCLFVVLLFFVVVFCLVCLFVCCCCCFAVVVVVDLGGGGVVGCVFFVCVGVFFWRGRGGCRLVVFRFVLGGFVRFVCLFAVVVVVVFCCCCFFAFYVDILELSLFYIFSITNSVGNKFRYWDVDMLH